MKVVDDNINAGNVLSVAGYDVKVSGSIVHFLICQCHGTKNISILLLQPQGSVV